MFRKFKDIITELAFSAVNIAEKGKYLLKQPPLKLNFPIEAMANAVQTMVRNTLDCFMNENVALARKVLESDDKIDDYNDKLYMEVAELMEKDSSTVRRALSILMIGRNLERMADLANNIAEDTIYLTQGKEVRHHFEGT